MLPSWWGARQSTSVRVEGQSSPDSTGEDGRVVSFSKDAFRAPGPKPKLLHAQYPGKATVIPFLLDVALFLKPAAQHWESSENLSRATWKTKFCQTALKCFAVFVLDIWQLPLRRLCFVYPLLHVGTDVWHRYLRKQPSKAHSGSPVEHESGNEKA